MDDPRLTLADFDSPEKAFAVGGTTMRAHAGRSVVRVDVDGRTHFLKRYWLTMSQVFQRHVARGLHELRVIDWLNEGGFAGPLVVARGEDRRWGMALRSFFLMEEVGGEYPLEQAWWLMPERCDAMVDALATFAANLHDAGFVHTDFSERHILVGRKGEDWTFRLIDVERARLGRVDDPGAAADLKTLAASIADQKLRERIGGAFLEDYIARRLTIEAGVDFRDLFSQAKATRSFV